MRKPIAFLFGKEVGAFTFMLFLLQHRQRSVQSCAVAQHHRRLLTWNVLAPTYASSSSRFSPPSDSKVLEWSHRRDKILDVMERNPADIFCLQEMQVDLWDEFLQHFRARVCKNATATTYTPILQNMTRHHPVACAVLINDSFWRLIRTESRSRAVIVVLEKRDPADTTSNTSGTDIFHKWSWSTPREPQQCSLSNKSRLYLAVVHLEAGASKENTRWSQMKSLLKRCHHHMLLSLEETNVLSSEKEDTTASSQQPFIIAGDFNMWSRNSELYQILNGEETPSPCSPSCTTLLPLRDTHKDDRPLLTYAGGSVLDYVWVRNLPEAVPWTIPIVQKPIHAVSKELVEPQPWPSTKVPSDHLPIGIEFLFL